MKETKKISAREGWVVNATFRPVSPEKRHSTHCTGGLVGPTVGDTHATKHRMNIRSGALFAT